MSHTIIEQNTSVVGWQGVMMKVNEIVWIHVVS